MLSLFTNMEIGGTALDDDTQFLALSFCCQSISMPSWPSYFGNYCLADVSDVDNLFSPCRNKARKKLAISN